MDGRHAGLKVNAFTDQGCEGKREPSRDPDVPLDRFRDVGFTQRSRSVRFSSRSVLLVTDYRGGFWSSTIRRRPFSSLDVEAICSGLRAAGFEPVVMTFEETAALDGAELGALPVLYTSMEDPGLFYKSFIEDVVQWLHICGARLIPPFPFLRAHHNKVFMELLRKQILPPGQQIPTKVYGSYEQCLAHPPSLPVVLKPAHGAGSSGVVLVEDERSLEDALKKVSRSRKPLRLSGYETQQRIKRADLTPMSGFRRKFVAQAFLPDLPGDYKVLVFDDRYFPLARSNRPGDFRASSSNIFSRDFHDPAALGRVLDYAQEAAQHIFRAGAPWASLDIGLTKQGCALLEFQAITFGMYTVETAPGYYSRSAEGVWEFRGNPMTGESAIVHAALSVLTS